MVDKALFMETLRSVQELAKASPEPMAREEIQGYFKWKGVLRCRGKRGK